MTQFRPLLAAKLEDPSKLRFPVLVSPKIDGVRCCVLRDGGAVTRTLKPLPNAYIRETLSVPGFDGLDGELVTYTGDTMDDFSTTQSKVMRRDGKPEFMFFVFDDFSLEAAFERRLTRAITRTAGMEHFNVDALAHVECASFAEVEEWERLALAAGHEGLMIRDPAGPYKYGRSTEKEGILLKVIRRDRAEATVVGVVEQMRNDNELTRDERGYAKRSTAKAGRSGAGVLGALVCTENGSSTFEIGTGFTAAQRAGYWGAALDGRTVTFEFRGRGPNGAPRFPTFVGFREKEDLL